MKTFFAGKFALCLSPKPYQYMTIECTILKRSSKKTDEETLFRAKLGRLAQLMQETIYKRALSISEPAPDYQERLLKCHAEISSSVQNVLG